MINSQVFLEAMGARYGKRKSGLSILEYHILSRVRMPSSLLKCLNEDFQGVGLDLIRRSSLEGRLFHEACHDWRMSER